VLNSTPARGQVTLNPNGTFSYTPETNFSGTDTFTYLARDPSGAETSATVTINVGVTNDAPVALADIYTTDEDVTLAVNAANGVLANDTDPDGDVTTAGLVNGPIHGTLT